MLAPAVAAAQPRTITITTTTTVTLEPDAEVTDLPPGETPPNAQVAVTSDAASSKQSAGAGGKADDKSKTADGSQHFSAALAVAVLVATTRAYVEPMSAATPHAITTTGAQLIHAGSKNSISAFADGAPADGTDPNSVGIAVAVTSIAFSNNVLSISPDTVYLLRLAG